MHGLGNDFVIFDGRARALKLTPEQVRQLADRRRGVGCDQVIVMEPSEHASVFMRIFNADGSESSACGNATRCVAWLWMQENQTSRAHVATRAGILECEHAGDLRVRVDMGTVQTRWQAIPLSEAKDTLHLGIAEGVLEDPVGVNLGNPHAVFFVANVQDIPLSSLGAKLEHHALFPERANIGIAQVRSRHHLALRVWERGVGETQACGTGACAALAAAHRRGLTERAATVSLPGGDLEIEWQPDNGQAPGHIFMTGAVAVSFEGAWNLTN